MDTLMKLEGVSKHFGGLVAVDNVSLEINKGEILGLIGPNGSGKSTTINLINGIYKLTSGSILYKDNDITKLQPYQRARVGISRTFQIVKPLKSLTVSENVMVANLFSNINDSLCSEFQASVGSKSVRHSNKETDEVLERVGLFKKRNLYAESLTLPDRKRLELARALTMKPELLLLDEVMAGLNNYEVNMIMDLIKEINSTGVSIVVIEHIMKAIMGVADRIAVLHHGKLIAQGTPTEVVNNEDVIIAYLGEKYKKKSNNN